MAMERSHTDTSSSIRPVGLSRLLRGMSTTRRKDLTEVSFPSIQASASTNFCDVHRPDSQWPLNVCAVTRPRIPVGASPVQPTAPAGKRGKHEATKCLKPSDSGHEFGDRARARAGKRVNAEQYSKRTKCRPIRYGVSVKAVFVAALLMSGNFGLPPEVN